MRKAPGQRRSEHQKPRSARQRTGVGEYIQSLENRTLLSAASSIVISPNVDVDKVSTSASYTAATGYTPSQIRDAYGFSSVDFSSGSSTVAGLGQGQTIAIVDAYNDPNIAKDLGTFDAQYGLSAPPSLKIVNQSGGSSLPATNAGWAGEISLDVEWAHAIAPDANILLVEANAASLNNLLSAVNYARNAAGVSVVSMSWGGSEFYGETAYDSYFTTPAGHQGVTFVAASGDSGSSFGAEWPAVSPNVISVGGTTLTVQNASGAYGSESAWADSTGGTSALEPQPSYQSVIPTSDSQSVAFNWFGGYTVSANRSAPDVAYDANPQTGFAVYDSVPYQGFSGWQVVGGTSAGAPQWGALIAIADQGRALEGLGTLNGASQALPSLYSSYSAPGTNGYSSYASNFHDVSAGGTYFDSATAGYDQLTGLGSPDAVQIINKLVGSTTTITTTATATSNKATAALRRSDLDLNVIPTPGVQSAPSIANAFFAASPLKMWAALEDQFSLSETTPANFLRPGFASLSEGFESFSGVFIGAHPAELTETASVGSIVASPALEGLAAETLGHWPADILHGAWQSSITVIETATLSAPNGLVEAVASFAGPTIASVVSAALPLETEAPAQAMTLPMAIAARQISGRSWATVAGVGLGAIVAGAVYLRTLKEEKEEQQLAASSLRLRGVRQGWELAPLEPR